MSKQYSFLLSSTLTIALYAVSTVAVAQDTHAHEAAAGDAHGHDVAAQDTHAHEAAAGDAHSHDVAAQGGHAHDAQAVAGAQGHDEGGHDHGDATYSVGAPATAADADRTIEVVMSDSMTYTFNPSLASIQDGEVINFVVSNSGRINHEFSIGNQEDQVEHAAMMARNPTMTHDDPNTVTVMPGGSKSIAWQFAGDDLVVFACNIPGHYQAGMFQKTAIEEGAEEHGDHAH